MALVTAGGVLASVAPAAARPAPPPAGSVPPAQDPFYVAPRNIASVSPGGIVATRPSTITIVGVQVPVRAWQISYRSNDSHNQPELAVTTLVVPTKTWTGSGPRPVVSLQSPEDSLGLQCAPSYTLTQGADVQDAALASSLISSNWAVSFPDYEGPRSVFFAGPQAGHAVLDGIRAVRRFRAGGIRKSNPWALSGYSGGAQATGWAAQLQPSYAPDVSLVGAAIGGLPADPAAVATSLDGGPFAGFEFAAAVGIGTEFPESGIAGLLNTQGQADVAKLAGECETTILGQFAFKRLADDSTVPSPLTVPSVAAVLKTDTLGAAAPSTPVYDYHADTDEIVPVGQDDTLVGAWCHAGATVQTHRDLIGEHATEVVAQMTAVTSFLTDRFAGTPPTSTC